MVMKNVFYGMMLFCFLSCKEECLTTQSDVSNVNSWFDLNKDFSIEKGTIIMIQSQFSIHTADEDMNAMVALYKYDDSQNDKEESSYSVGGIPLNLQSHKLEYTKDYMGLYGHNIPVVQHLKSHDGLTTSDTTYMYVPTVIRLREDPDTIKSGVKIFWNKDVKNSQGVLVQIESLSGMSNNFVKSSFLVEDIGSFVLTDAHLAKFQDGEQLTMNLVRGSISISDTKTIESYKTGIISSVIWSGSLKK